MKKLLLCLCLLLSVFIAVPNVIAGEIAVVNLDEIIKNSTAMTKFTKDLEKQKSDMEKKLKLKEDNLANEKNSLQSELTHLSDSLAQEKASAFQKKVFDFQGEIKDNESTLQKKYMDGILEVTNSIRSILVEMKSEKNSKYTYTVVLPKSSAIYNDNGIDVSAEVLARLNKRLKKISIK